MKEKRKNEDQNKRPIGRRHTARASSQHEKRHCYDAHLCGFASIPAIVPPTPIRVSVSNFETAHLPLPRTAKLRFPKSQKPGPR